MAYNFGKTHFGEGSFNSLFKNPYQFSAGRVDSDTSKSILDAIRKRQQFEETELVSENRSMLDRGLDALMMPNYMIAGAVDGMVSDDRTVWEGISEGARAGNPFGKGFQEGETTFSNVIESAGWKPESMLGKITKGTLGFGLDVLLDPTTYLTGGASAIAKGTGRVGKATETLATLSKTFGDGSEITHMSKELAEKIILKEGKELSAEQLAKDSESLANKYNKLLGIRDAGGGKDITFGLGNMPFGDKLGKYGKTVKLSDGNNVRAFADKIGTARAYAGLREGIYGSKIGKFFSTNAPIKRLADENPSELYKFMKFIDYTKGLNMDKLAKEKAIREKASTLKFTSHESKQIIAMLEDKTVWSKVKNTLKFSETKGFSSIAKVVKEDVDKSKAELDDLLSTRRTLDSLYNMKEQGALDNKKMLNEMQQTYRDELSKIDMSLLKDKRQTDEVVNALKEDRGRIQAKLEKLDTFQGKGILSRNVEDVGKHFDDLMKSYEVESVVKSATHKANLDKNMKIVHKEQMVDELSEYIFGTRGTLNITLGDNTIADFVGRIKRGETPDQIAKHIEDNPQLYTAHAKDVYAYLGEKYGYQKWSEAFTEPMKELHKKRESLKLGEELSPKDEQKWHELLNLNHKRRVDYEKLFKGMEHKDFIKFRTDEANKKMDEIFKEVEPRLNTHEQSDGFVDRSKFNATDAERGTIDEYSKLTGKEDQKRNMNKMKGEYEKKPKPPRVEYQMYADVVKAMGGVQPGVADSSFVERVVQTMHKFMQKEFPDLAYDKLTDNHKNFFMKDAMDAVKKGDVSPKLEGRYHHIGKQMKLELDKRQRASRVQEIKNMVDEGTVIGYSGGNRAMDFGTVEGIRVVDDQTIYDVRIKGELIPVELGRVSYIQDGRKFINPKELVETDNAITYYTKRSHDLMVEINGKILKNITGNVETYKKRETLVNFFETRLAEQKTVIMNLERDARKVADRLYEVDKADIPKVSKRINQQLDALASTDAMEDFIRASMDGKFIDKVLHDENVANSVKVALSERPGSDEMKKAVAWLREEFNKMGLKEVEIGKLDEAQFAEMMQRYVPRVPTVEGERYFNSMKELKEHGTSVTRDLGYGTKWNPYAKERTIKGSGISDINKEFSEVLKGKNLFSENLADIYITRALKHEELVYDNEYMNEMMSVFGRDIRDEGISDGFKAVANYGQVRELVKKLTKDKFNAYVKMNQPAESEMASLYQKYLDESLGELGFSANALDEKATPMLELTREQIEKLKPHGIAKEVNDAIVDKANQARKLSQAKDESRALQLYDKFLHFMKLNQTSVMPSFHVRNKASNVFQNWLGVGRDAFDLKMQRDTFLASKSYGDVEKLRKIRPITTTNGEVYHWDEIYNLALGHNVIDEGFFAQDIGAGAMSSGILKNKLKPSLNPTDTANFMPYKVGAKVGTLVENSDRLIHFTSMLKQGKTVQEASESSIKYLFDYSDLTAFEKTWMKRIFPYYTWMRKNGRLQVSEFIEQPGKYQMVAKGMNGVQGMNNEEDIVDDRYVSDFAKDWIQTPFSFTKKDENGMPKMGKDGKPEREPILLSPNMPFMDLARLPDPTQMGNTIREFASQTAPQLKVPVELAMNKNLFFNSEITKTDEEGNFTENPVAKGIGHMAKQLAPINAISGATRGEGGDNALSLLGSLSGLKMTAYDYQMSKQMMIVEAMKNPDGGSMIDRLTSAIGKKMKIGGKEVTSFNTEDKYPAKYKIDENDVATFEKRKAMANKQIQAKYPEFTKDSKLQWSLIEGSENFETAVVKEVFDGDTFLATNEKGEDIKVRMLLVDTPETADSRKDYKMPVGQEASKYAKDTLSNQKIILFKDGYGDEKDMYERQLAYVHVGGMDFAKSVIEKGYGRTFFEQNQERLEEYKDAQRQASERKEGIWAYEDYANPEGRNYDPFVRDVREWRRSNQ